MFLTIIIFCRKRGVLQAQKEPENGLEDRIASRLHYYLPALPAAAGKEGEAAAGAVGSLATAKRAPAAEAGVTAEAAF